MNSLSRVLIFLLISLFATAQNEGWHRISWQPSKALDGDVFALIYWDDGTGPALIAAGDFVSAGWQPARRIARWDGVTWTQLGDGLNAKVRALAVYQGELIATGDFTHSGVRGVNHIARWNGREWLPFGSGLSERGRALAVQGSNLYVGGDFLTAGRQQVNRVARWDGQEWSTLANGVASTVHALHVFGGELHAATLLRVAKWNGTAWTELAQLGGVLTLTTFNNELIAGGYFAPGMDVNYVARWTGNAWAPLATGFQAGEVRTLQPYGSQLIAGGRLHLWSQSLRSVAVWDGVRWSELAPAPNDGLSGGMGYVNAMATLGQDLILGGEFRMAGSIGAPSIVKWNQGWTSFALGIVDSVESVHVHDQRLVVGGFFTSVPGVANGIGIAAWDGLNWSALGSGVSGSVADLASYRNELVAVGYFSSAGGVSADGIARWNGTVWRPLGLGVQGVNALAVNDGDLVATGGFSMAGSVAAFRWALWDGNDWRAMPTFDPFAPGTCARRLGGSLYGCANGQVARLDNGAWTLLGPAFNGRISDIHLHGGVIYIAGDIVGGVMAWDGISWQSVGGLSNFVGEALTTWNGALIVAGTQQVSGTKITANVRRLVGEAWIPLGESFEEFGTNGRPYLSDMNVYNGRIIVAGNFSGVAGERAVNLIGYGPRIPTIVEIVSITPNNPALGQAAEIMVRVQSGDGAPRGLVSVTGAPRGVCSTEAFELAANASVARCHITFLVPGPVRMHAQYSGGSLGAQTWAPSFSNSAFITTPGETVFRDGFEAWP